MSDQSSIPAGHKVTIPAASPPAGGGRRFACPGLFRIIPSRDGGICRVKLRRGTFTSAQARRLAESSTAYGSGIVEATNRSNFQIRGIRAGAETGLIAAMLDAGFGTSGPGADDVRNVMVSPMAGIDPAQVVDVTGLADRVLESLEAGTAYHALSPKFSILIDGGEAMAMTVHPHDIWLSAVDSDTFAFGFSGCPPHAGTDTPAAGSVPVGGAHAAVMAVLDLFLDHARGPNAAGTEITRMRHLTADLSQRALLARLQALLPFPLGDGPGTVNWRRPRPADMAHIGIACERDSARVAVGAAPPLGRLDPAMLHGLANVADLFSAGVLRLTPWQSLMLPGVATNVAADALQALAALGLVTRTDKVLASMVACAGSTGCGSGLADTKADAAMLARMLDADGGAPAGIHLTGCAKSCAAPLPAPVTMLGVAPGRYDLFVRQDGIASAFGKRLAANITIEQARELLARHPRLDLSTVAE